MAMRVAIVIRPGQSGEEGVAGTEWGQTRAGFGYPMVDRPGVRSMWPMTSELCGRAGISTLILNRAVGSTGMCNYWIGNARNHVNGMFVNLGSYAIYAGKLWKVIDPNTTNNDVYGTSTVAPSAVVGADNIQWQDMGAVTAEDVNGAIYTRTSSRFDPNGAMAGGRDAVLAAKNVDRRFALGSIGQGDKTTGMTLAQYQAAYEQFVRYDLEAGIEVIAGLTLIGRTAGLPEWMRDVGDPAWQNICSRFAGTRGFHVGANLYRELGGADPYTSNLVAATAPTPGLLPDNLHPNSAAYDLGAACQARAIIRSCSEAGF